MSAYVLLVAMIGAIVLAYKDKILLADEFTPDGCRLWDSETLKKMDKDRFRQGLGDVVESYHQVADRLGMNIET